MYQTEHTTLRLAQDHPLALSLIQAFYSILREIPRLVHDRHPIPRIGELARLLQWAQQVDAAF
jgi:hypothetical protein